MPDDTPTIFISYGRKDMGYLEELREAVRPTLRNVSSVQAWADEAVEPAHVGAAGAVARISTSIGR